MKKICLFFVFVASLIFMGCNSTRHTNSVSNSNDFSKDTLGKLASFNGDTIAYLNHIVSNKRNFIGKPVSFFLESIEVPIGSFSTLINRSNKNFNYGISIYTEDLKSYYNKYDNGNKDAYKIVITWKELQPEGNAKAIMENNVKEGKSSTDWSSNAKSYFGKIIVGNIELPYYLKK